jgi:hypothetical protein
MGFQEQVQAVYPGTLSEADFLTNSCKAMQGLGFESDNTLACVGVCRDEITASLVDGVQALWGEAFQLGGLAGLLYLGRTGFRAALHHSPKLDGKERYVFYAMAHVAIGPGGEIGFCERVNRPGPSSACGALVAFTKELQTPPVSLELDGHDYEISLLRRRLVPSVPTQPAPDLLIVTGQAYTAILEDLEDLIANTIDPQKCDYGVFAGIQIHAPQRVQLVWPGISYAVVNSERHDLRL